MTLDINHYNALFLDNPGQNDATKYGVKMHRFIDTALPHFRCIGVHHLTPGENAGKHHVFLDVLNEQGQRMHQAQIEWTWQGRRLEEPAPPVTIDKPDTEPGTNIPINWAQTITLSILNQRSDAVTNLHTRHSDESSPDAENGTVPAPGGNTRGHHSFYVVFQHQSGDGAPTPPPAPGCEELLIRIAELAATLDVTVAKLQEIISMIQEA